MFEAVQLAGGLTKDELRLLTYQDREVMLRTLVRAQRQLIDVSEKTRVALVVVRICELLQAEELLDKKFIAESASRSQALLSENSPGRSLSAEHQHTHAQLLARKAALARSRLWLSTERTPPRSLNAAMSMPHFVLFPKVSLQAANSREIPPLRPKSWVCIFWQLKFW